MRLLFKRISTDPNALVAVFTLFAAIISAIGVFFAWRASAAAERIALQGQLTSQIQQYLDSYQRIFSDSEIKDPFNVYPYSILNKSQKLRVTVVGGLLVGVVDTMIASNDRRKDEWEGYFIGMPSLLLCEDALESYAREEKTIKAIRLAKEKARAAENIARRARGAEEMTVGKEKTACAS